MRISRIAVRNFRNLANLDVQLQPDTVIVGENRAGKSNLLHVLRLILDTSLSYADQQLRREDFWDGLSDGSESWDPMAASEVIEASIDIEDFENNTQLMAALADALLADEPMRARLTYRFAPVDTGERAAGGTRKYQGVVFGGGQEDRRVSRELRRYLHLQFLHALRDVEADIRSWRRSPLRDLLETAAQAVPEDDLESVRRSMKAANDELNSLSEIKQLGESISDRLTDMVGSAQAVDTELAVAPDDPLRLIRTMRLFVDGDAHRSLSSASLGTLNVLYLALLEQGLDQRLLGTDIAHVVLAIEEPEAHLHPHLQRLIFRRLFDPEQNKGTVLVTTQSPHIASVADPRSLMVLRTVDGQTRAAAASSASLSTTEWDDLARYLDATRAELVFARRVLLVEGFAEQVMIPALAHSLQLDVDKLGISVCAIHGTHFGTYIRFCQALDIPWAVVTDADMHDEAGVSDGAKRAASLQALLDLAGDHPSTGSVFVGRSTFEYDLLTANLTNLQPCFEALYGLCAEPSQRTIDLWRTQTTPPAYKDFMTMINNAGGKGRYAQRLALTEVTPPTYIADALRYLAAR